MKRPIFPVILGVLLLLLISSCFRSTYSTSTRKPQSSSSLQHSSSNLKRQLQLAFPYYRTSSDLPFPRIIWQTWKTAPGAADWPSTFDDLRQSWANINPDTQIRLLTDEDAARIVEEAFIDVPDVVSAYNLMPLPILKADFFRYLILLYQGGTYTDIDTEALKPAETWVEYAGDQKSTVGIVIGIEADPDREDWHDWFARRIQFCQWTIQSRPRHPILVEVVARITEKTLFLHHQGRLDGNETMEEILDHTGPGIWTDAIFTHFNKSQQHARIDNATFFNLREPMILDDALILPITSFSPGIGHMGSEGTDHPLALVRHAFGGE